VVELVRAYLPYAVSALIVLNIILILLIIFYIDRVKKLRRRFERFMTPNSKNHNVEQMILDNIQLVKEIKAENERIKFEQDYINNRLKNCVQYMGIVRYNTFEDVGGDFSYAVALMDEGKNGVVLNSLYYRQGCYTYGKPIVDGKCEYQLSPEEEQAIEAALNADKPKPKKNFERKRIIFKKRKNKKQENKGDAMITKDGRRSNEVAGA